MSELRLPEKTLVLWKLRVTIFTALFIGVFSYFCHSFSWYLVSILLIICIYEGVMLWYLPYLFKNYSIKYINGAVVVTSGVIIRVTHIMPFSKMIYTQSITSPIARFLGLTAMTLKAARSRILIPELPHAEVEKFAKALAEGEL